MNYKIFYEANYGKILNGDSYEALSKCETSSVNLIITSPPFGLIHKKDYGNVEAEEYIEWFKPFGEEFNRVLTNNGSLVIDIGGAWNKGYPTRNLYHFKLLLMLCEQVGFHLAQEFYWWNPSKLPTPAEWVTVRRIRVKDAVNNIWWLSKTPWPKASNRRVGQPYSQSMQELLENGYQAKKRPSGHDISKKFQTDNGAAIPPNLLAIANTKSNCYYRRYCEKHGLKPHPARYPSELPEYFIRMLTDEDDKVLDPFAGSCVTGEICERLKRRWLCVELQEHYCQTALAHFTENPQSKKQNFSSKYSSNYYLSTPDALWDKNTDGNLPEDGGKNKSN